MAADVVICGAAIFIVDLERLAYSVLSAVALGVVMFAYHRPGRYVGY